MSKNRQIGGEKIDQWLPRAMDGDGGLRLRGNDEWLLMGMEFLLGGNENVLNLIGCK